MKTKTYTCLMCRGGSRSPGIGNICNTALLNLGVLKVGDKTHIYNFDFSGVSKYCKICNPILSQ